MNPRISLSAAAVLFFAGISSSAAAQTTTAPPVGPTEDAISQSLLQDYNGNGVVEIAAFGDSITRGEGDFTSPSSTVYSANSPRGKAGYPLRIEAFLGLPVRNLGFSGEDLTTIGVGRFIKTIPRVLPDVVIIAEGSNDARLPATPGEYYRALQTVINVAHAVGTKVVLGSIVPSCLGHAFLQRFLDTYNPQVYTLAVVNNLPVADFNHAFRNTCNPGNCKLINRPEGLHPNIDGYDVMGEVASATLLNISMTAPDGPTLLSQALNIPVTAFKTVPDAAPPEM